MSPYFDLALDRPRRYKLTVFDARDALRFLDILANAGGGGRDKTTPVRMLGLLMAGDPDTFAQVLFVGLRHEDPKLNHEKVLKIWSDYLEDGGDPATVATVIVEAGIASGVWEKSEARKGEKDEGNAPPPLRISSS